MKYTIKSEINDEKRWERQQDLIKIHEYKSLLNYESFVDQGKEKEQN